VAREPMAGGGGACDRLLGRPISWLTMAPREERAGLAWPASPCLALPRLAGRHPSIRSLGRVERRRPPSESATKLPTKDNRSGQANRRLPADCFPTLAAPLGPAARRWEEVGRQVDWEAAR